MKKIILYFFFFCLVLLIFFSSFFLALAGKFLVKNDPLRKADIIIVLAGEYGERVRYGVLLYKQGYADKILFSGGSIAGFPGEKKITWAGLMKNYAVRLGVPENAIIIQDESRSTQEDAAFSFRILQGSHLSSAILVTSPYHNRRAFNIFKPVFKDIKIRSVPVADSWYGVDSWWKSSKGRFQVLREYFAFLWFFLENIGPG